MALNDLLTIKEGVRLYIKYCEEHKGEEIFLKPFFTKYDIKKKKLLSPRGSQLERYIQRYIKLRRKNKLPEGVVEFEDWVIHHISDDILRRKFEGILPRRYSIEQGVELYVQYLQKYKKKSKSLGWFFVYHEIETNEPLKRKRIKKLYRHYIKYGSLKRKRKLPRGMVLFEDWVASQVPERLKQRLEELTEKYIPKKEVKEYSLAEGVEFYIKHLEKHKERSKPIKRFFIKYDTENDGFHSKREYGHLDKYYRKFNWLRRNRKLPKGITAFEDWIGLQIPKKLKQRLEELTERYRPEYSVEEGAEFYIKHLEKHKERSKPIKRFFIKYDTENNGFHSEEERGHLNKYYKKFEELKDNGKLPRGITTFEEWIKSQIPKKLKQRLEKLTEKYLREYSLEQGVEFYIQHLEGCREKSEPIKKFFENYNPKKKKILRGRGEGRKLRRYYKKFGELKNNGKLPEGVTQFEDYLISNLPEEKRERAEYYLKGGFLKDVAKKKIDRDKLGGVVFGGD